MSDLFNNARKLQIAKRSVRLIESTRKAKTDAQKNSYGSYQGKDPNDGTDIVKAGNNEAVSGFKLTSDSPVGTGDRVNLKKNNDGGLQRADSRNRLPPADDNLVESALIFTTLIIFLVASTSFGGNGTQITFQSDPFTPVSENNSFLNFIFKDQRSAPRIQKKTPSIVDFLYIGTTPLELRGITGDPTLRLNNGAKVLADFTPNAAIPNSELRANFQVVHTVKRSAFPRMLRWAQTTPPSGVQGVYTFEESPLEINISINNVTINEPDILNYGLVEFVAAPSNPLAIFIITIQVYPVDFSEQYTAAYRFRARGNPNWFTL
jgi:hypothetical protein